MNNKKLNLNYRMMYVAELYNQNPNDPIFKKYSAEAMRNVKLLATSIKKQKDKGNIK
jgi:hypothetical protein